MLMPADCRQQGYWTMWTKAMTVAAMLLGLPFGSAQAASWCAGDGQCGFRTHVQCVHARGVRAGCHLRVARRDLPPASAWAPPPDAGPGPAWRSPYECFMDEGYGRYSRCSAGGVP
jgi:hypothetical protein